MVMKPQLAIRTARQSDKEEVFRFCENTFEWGDYISNVWNRWSKEKQAQLFTALFCNKPVGIMRVAMLKPGEAWLQAARTHPDYRRQGVATALTHACLRWARSKGAGIVRLATESGNMAAQRMLDKLGFTRLSDFLILKCEKMQPEETESSKWARKGDVDKTWRFLANSGIFKESGRLYTILYTWMSLKKPDLAEFVDQNKVVVHESNEAVDGLVLMDDTVRKMWRERSLQTCYIDGDYEVIVDMMRFFKTYACRRRVKIVYAFACNLPVIEVALAESGFSREDHEGELVYEKEIIWRS